MKAFLTLAALMALAPTAKAGSRLVLDCHSAEYDVVVSVKKAHAKDLVSVLVYDFSGHGKEYSTLIDRGSAPQLLGSGLTLTSTTDGAAITITAPGKATTVTGDFNIDVQCTDLNSDNPSGD